MKVKELLKKHCKYWKDYEKYKGESSVYTSFDFVKDKGVDSFIFYKLIYCEYLFIVTTDDAGCWIRIWNKPSSTADNLCIIPITKPVDTYLHYMKLNHFTEECLSDEFRKKLVVARLE